MSGIADLVAAFAGGDRLENEAYYRHGKRILDAQNSQALLDKRVQDAVNSANMGRYKQNFENVFTPDMSHPDALKYAILSGLGGDLKSGIESIGAGKENELLNMAMQVIQGQQQNGAPPADLLNMIVGARDGRLLGPGNVMVQGQAQADLGKTIADTVAAIKLGDARGALASQRNTDPTTGGVPDMEDITSTEEAMLYGYPDQITFMKDNPGIFTGESEVTAPLTDPAAAQAWAEMEDDERLGYMRDDRADFMRWRAEKIKTDPRVADKSFAIGLYMTEKMAGTNPQQRAVADEATQQSQQAQQAQLRFATPDDLGAAIAAGVVKPGDVVMTPEGPRVVK